MTADFSAQPSKRVFNRIDPKPSFVFELASTSMPRYLTVLSNLLWPSSSCTARMFRVVFTFPKPLRLETGDVIGLIVAQAPWSLPGEFHRQAAHGLTVRTTDGGASRAAGGADCVHRSDPAAATATMLGRYGPDACSRWRGFPRVMGRRASACARARASH